MNVSIIESKQRKIFLRSLTWEKTEKYKLLSNSGDCTPRHISVNWWRVVVWQVSFFLPRILALGLVLLCLGSAARRMAATWVLALGSFALRLATFPTLLLIGGFGLSPATILNYWCLLPILRIPWTEITEGIRTELYLCRNQVVTCGVLRHFTLDVRVAKVFEEVLVVERCAGI